MATVKWIKITTDIFDDEKILLIENMPDADSIIVIWFKLLAFAGKQNNSGVFMLNDRIAYTDEMLATIFRRPLHTVRLALKTFEQFGMIEVVNNTITIPNWGKHQSIDQLENKKDYMRNYMQEYRDKQKMLTSGDCKPLRKTNSKTNSKPLRKTNVSSLDIEEEQEEKEEKEYIESSVPPHAPTLEEVKKYCAERGNKIDAQRFYDYYSALGWVVGDKPITDWKAKVRAWEKTEHKKTEKTESSFDAQEFFQAALNKSYGG